MNNTISFTPAELAAFIITISGAIVTIAAAVGVLIKIFNKAKEPEKMQDARLNNIDRRLDEHDQIIKQFREYFTNDDNRFKAIEKSNKITQTALLALLKHSLNGNDIDSLKAAEKSLEEYLIAK